MADLHSRALERGRAREGEGERERESEEGSERERGRVSCECEREIERDIPSCFNDCGTNQVIQVQPV